MGRRFSLNLAASEYNRIRVIILTNRDNFQQHHRWSSKNILSTAAYKPAMGPALKASMTLGKHFAILDIL